MKRRLAPCPAWPEGPSDFRWRPSQQDIRHAFDDGEARNGFLRGFIAAGLVATTQARAPKRRQALRLALQSGTAMAAAIAGANALDRRDYASALIAVAAGAAGLSALNYLLPESPTRTKEVSDEQEKA